MVVFKSIIVLDLETTSLPQIDYNTTKITELSFIGCEIAHLINAKQLPRVLHKLLLLFNPNKLISPSATEVSGLDNELLMNLPPFTQEDVEVLRQFISRLPSPVCIVAHNGDNFDFPILRRALVKVNKNLQDNVYCVDSLKAFACLLPQPNRPMRTIRPEESISPCTPPEKTQSLRSVQYKNISRELFPDDEAFSQWASSQDDGAYASQSGKKRRSLRLSEVYKYYFGSPFACPHRAEEDAKALLGCIMRCEGFLDWMNVHAVVFNTVEPL